ncbi:hypothetical protein SAMN05421842_1292 [Clostridium uliginosum]|uniref:Uncharacterized protein n=1 Tax=Clostridium uliginosum TaxID=119641 RepID=A0A1I1QZN7_9CLOT|nr:hypothetical protein SAMN05421842_1292 [Clostridium uliginosum]
MRYVSKRAVSQGSVQRLHENTEQGLAWSRILTDLG